MFHGAIIDCQTAHVHFQAASFDPGDPSGWMRPGSTISDWRGAAAAAPRVPRVFGVAPALELACFVGDGYERLPALLAGVVFSAEPGVSVFSRRVSGGSLLSERGQVLVGSALSRLFSLDPGSKLLVQSTTSGAAPNIARFSGSGIFGSGFACMDAGLVCALLAALATAIVYAMYAISLAVAWAGIANSVLLSVRDLTRDFATLRAVAFSAGWVKAIVAVRYIVLCHGERSDLPFSPMAMGPHGPHSDARRLPPSTVPSPCRLGPLSARAPAQPPRGLEPSCLRLFRLPHPN